MLHFGFANPADQAAFVEALRRHDYNDRGLIRALAVPNVNALAGMGVPQLAARLTGQGPLDHLLRLFWVSQPVPATAMEQALAPLGLERLEAAGFVAVRGGEVHPRVAVAILDDIAFVHDSTGLYAEPDFAMGAGATTFALLRHSVRPKVRRTLDLGCGPGVSTLYSAHHSEHVVGTDINPRALDMARLNAALNPALGQRCEFRQGSWFQPVKGETFDLILANLPFVITDGTGDAYFSGNMQGDSLTESIIRQTPAHLAEGAFATIVCNWANLRATDPAQRLSSWTSGLGCDALFLAWGTIPAQQYAIAWVNETVPGTPERKMQACQRWLEAYERQGIESISCGVAVLRKNAAGPNWFGIDAVPEQIPASASEQLIDIFKGRSLLASCGTGPEGEQRLGAIRVSPSPRLRARQHLRPGSPWKLDKTEFETTGPYLFTRQFDQKQADFVLGIDAGKTLADVAQQAAERAQVPVNVLAPVCLKVARQLLERGMLL